MAHAHCMLHTEGYKDTLRICNTHCFSTATMVARTRLIVTLYEDWLCCSVWLFKRGEQLPDFTADQCPAVTRHVQEKLTTNARSRMTCFKQHYCFAWSKWDKLSYWWRQTSCGHRAQCCRTLQHRAQCCSTLQHRAQCCRTLQPRAQCCSTLQHETWRTQKRPNFILVCIH
jgi:hypothetical protein